MIDMPRLHKNGLERRFGESQGKLRKTGRLEDWKTARERSTARNGIAGFMPAL